MNSHLDAIEVQLPEFKFFQQLTSNEKFLYLTEIYDLETRKNSDIDIAENLKTFFDDITELLSAQKKAAWSDIAQRIAHEIRNPLTPLQLSVEKIYKKFKPKDPNEIKIFNNYLETIQRQVDDIGNLVGEFSSFARMPSVNLYPGDLNNVILTQLSLFKISNSNI